MKERSSGTEESAVRDRMGRRRADVMVVRACAAEDDEGRWRSEGRVRVETV